MSTSSELSAQDSQMTSTSEENAGAEMVHLFISVQDTLAKEADEINFAIGGKINLKDLASEGTGPSGVTIRWDSRSRTQPGKVTLPLNLPAEKKRFSQLVKDAEPATFGLGCQEVLDESYRKAGKIDEDKFCTNFNPYEHGIMDTITQALIETGGTLSCMRGVRAELYKLNVYSGPSGKFKAHVDTPRSQDQMGSLVVCLPHQHKGGQLAVRHQGREVIFDWAHRDPTSIQWAAFFSDCEHEVMEVTEGHRITLAYNLFWVSHGPTMQSDQLGAVDLESTVFFSALRKLLEYPGFNKKGRLIGFKCTHAYPHCSQASADTLHHTLKGIDMLVYQALKLLVGNARFNALLDDSDFKRSRDSDDEDDDSPRPFDFFSTMAPVTDWTGPPTVWGTIDERHIYPDPECISHCLRTGPGGAWQEEQVYERREVAWLNFIRGSEIPRELAVAFATYGNEPGIDAYYSSAVIIAELQGKE